MESPRPKATPGQYRYLSINERLAQLRQLEATGEKVPADLRQSYRAPTPSRESAPRKPFTPRTSFNGRKSFQPSRSSGLRQSTQGTRDQDVDGLLERFKRVTYESPEDLAVREREKLRKRRLQAEKGVAGRAHEREEEERKALEEERAREEEQKAEEEQRALEALQAAEAAEKAAEEAKKNLLIRPLEEKWATIVDDAMGCTTAQKVFSKGPDGSDVTRYMLGRILPQAGECQMAAGMSNKKGPAAWLNDECVDIWIAMIVARRLEKDGYVKGPNNIPPLAAYLSAFWKNYEDKGVNSIKGWSRRKGISGKKLLGVERIFFPVNTGAHWILIVISPKDRIIEVFDSASTSASSRFFRFARDWLAMELGEDYHPDEWQHSSAQSSQQLNWDDCGVFTCVNALASAKNKPPSAVIASNGMQDARSMMVAVLINGGFKEDWEL